jgi:hypothetical protein
MANAELTEPIDAPEVNVSSVPSLAFVTDQNWHRERLAFYRMLPELLKIHEGRFVAILDGAIVGIGDDFISVATELYARLGRVSAYIGYVAEQPRFARAPSVRMVNLGEARPR